MRIHYCVSDFDILEVSKIDQLAQLRDTCDRLVVGLVSDHDLERVAGRVLHPLADRLDLVAQLRGVDRVYPHVAGSVPNFGGEHTVKYFATDRAFQPLMAVASTVVRTRTESSSDFVPAKERAAAPMLAIG